ncbi:MAG: AI-2E family transporter [Bacteroidetes bacterium]|nr:MAG: AI-2E family transporter [Bacteroidota bacterium]
MSQRLKIILVTFLVLGSFFFLIIGLTRGKGFLIPLVTAMILSMVMNPVARKLKDWGLKWGLAVFLADLVIILFIGLMVFLLAAQGSQVVQNWSQIEERLKPRIQKVEDFMNQKLNMQVSIPFGPGGGNQQQDNPKQNPENQQQRNQQQGNQQDQQQGKQQEGQDQQQDGQDQQQAGQQQAGQQTGQGQGSTGIQFSRIRDSLASVISGVLGLLGDLLLLLVYVFFFMFYQKKFEDAVTGLAPENKRDKTRKIIGKSARVAQQYLFGRFILILFLAAFYMAGYSIVGLKYAFFISLIAAIFSLIPYVGNLVGLLLAISLSFLSGEGNTGMIIGIVIVYAISQFIESYVLEPFIIGERVDLNPVAIIVGVILGGTIWGVMGMLLAIPVLGILRVIFDNVESLKAFGFALDSRGISTGGGVEEKVKNWIRDRFKKN